MVSGSKASASRTSTVISTTRVAESTGSQYIPISLLLFWYRIDQFKQLRKAGWTSLSTCACCRLVTSRFISRWQWVDSIFVYECIPRRPLLQQVATREESCF